MSEVQSDSTNDSQLIQECQMDREPFFIDWLNEREIIARKNDDLQRKLGWSFRVLKA